MIKIHQLLLGMGILLIGGCQSKTKENKDEVYSRHLQKHIGITVISTPVPKDRGDFNLLLLNDGQDADSMRIREMVDSLFRKKSILPLIVVAINPFDRLQEYGVAAKTDYLGNGSLAEKYGNFIENELLPFVKKKSGVRKFQSITIAGWSLGGLSAFDVAWDHADKIDKVGVFSGAFWYRDKDLLDPTYSDDKDRLIFNKVRTSRKRPHLKYWFYAGSAEETADRDRDGIIDVVDDTRDLAGLILDKKICPPSDIVFTELKTGKHDLQSWRSAFPAFLIWAVGRN